MRCSYSSCRNRAVVYLESIGTSYCRRHFYEVAYELFGPKKLEEKLGKKRLRKIQRLLGVQL